MSHKSRRKPKKKRNQYMVYEWVRRYTKPIVKWLFGISEKDRLQLPDEPCLVLANHTCYFDPLIVADSLKQPVTYVASESLLRNPISKFVFTKCFSVIPCEKGKQNTEAVREIAHRIRDGEKVLMFAEGNITYDGATAPAMPATGKLAKLLKHTVVTVQTDGGYMVCPRWSKKICRGRITSKIVNVYSPEQLKAAKASEVQAWIDRDLYNEQPKKAKNDGLTYHRPADGVGYVLYVCPRCGRLGRIRGRGRRIICDCGTIGRWNRYGKIDKGPFETLYEWNRWQKERIAEMFEKNEPINASVLGAELLEITEDHRRETVAEGTLSMDGEHIECGKVSFPLDQIVSMDTRNKGILLFSADDGRYFEVRAKGGYPGLLFKTVFEAWEASNEKNDINLS